MHDFTYFNISSTVIVLTDKGKGLSRVFVSCKEVQKRNFFVKKQMIENGVP